MKKIKSRKELLNEFENIFLVEQTSYLAKTFNHKTNAKIEDIILKAPLSKLEQQLKAEIDKSYHKKRLHYIITQAFGLFICITLSALIYMQYIPPKNMWLFIAWIVMIFLYLILQNLSFQNSKRRIKSSLELIKDFGYKKNKN